MIKQGYRGLFFIASRDLADSLSELKSTEQASERQRLLYVNLRTAVNSGLYPTKMLEMLVDLVKQYPQLTK